MMSPRKKGADFLVKDKNKILKIVFEKPDSFCQV